MVTTLEIIEQQELFSAREKAVQIVQLARDDAAFHQEVTRDPAAILRLLGLPENARPTFSPPEMGKICIPILSTIRQSPGLEPEM